MLDQLIAGLIAGTIKSPHRQHGGATLHWNVDRRMLSVWRDNEIIKPAECTTYEKYIRRAGYTPGKRMTESVTTNAPAAGDYRYFVRWTLNEPAANLQIGLL